MGLLQLALSTVSTSVLVVSPRGYEADGPHALTVGDGPVHLRPPDGLLQLHIVHWYRIVEDSGPRGPWRVTSAGYHYLVSGPGENGERPEDLFAYHWHPSGQSHVTTPHLHFWVGHKVELGHLARQIAQAHIPTGRISLEQVLRLIIEELNVPTRRGDWAEILDEGQAFFEGWRSWR